MGLGVFFELVLCIGAMLDVGCRLWVKVGGSRFSVCSCLMEREARPPSRKGQREKKRVHAEQAGTLSSCLAVD